MGKVAKGFWSAAGATHRGSAEGEFRVERDAVFFQEREKFRVEGDFFVVGFLILDVADYGGDLRGAYAEGGVAVLDRKSVV